MLQQKEEKKLTRFKMTKKDLKQITITQKKSLIGKTKKQISCIKGLGLRRINHQITLTDTAEVRGMIKVVKHMVETNN
jgi:large subunit ribosomal protein L30